MSDIKSGGFLMSKIRDMLPSSMFGFVEPKGFDGVSRDDRDRLSDTFLRIKRNPKVLKNICKQISVWQRGGTCYTGDTIHVLEDDGVVINRISPS